MKKPQMPDLLVSLLLSVAVLLASTVVMKAYEVLTFRAVAIGVAMVACVFLIMVILVLAFENKEHRAELEHIVNRLKEVVPPKPAKLDWLYRDSDLAEAESKVEGNNIWIVSPDLKNVIEKEDIRGAVKQNIERGIKYTYIVPDSESVNGMLPRVRNLDKSNRRRLKIIQLPENEFRILSVTHIAIFNATMMNGLPPEVFIELPIEEAEGSRIRGYWIKASNDAANGFVGRFSHIVSRSKGAA